VRQLSRLTNLPSTIVYRSLAESLGFVARHLRWVPNALSDAPNGERVNPSRRRLRMLEVQRDRAWHDIVTVNESWFYLSTDYEFVWLPQDEKFPKENDTQFNRKNSCSCRLESARVPFDQDYRKGRKFKAGYYIAEILESLSK
jgi:hypothetical protein